MNDEERRDDEVEPTTEPPDEQQTHNADPLGNREPETDNGEQDTAPENDDDGAQ
jgi:hypothetical protein